MVDDEPSVSFSYLILMPERRAPRELLSAPGRRPADGGCRRSWLYWFRISLKLLDKIWSGSSSGKLAEVVVAVAVLVVGGSTLLVLVLAGSKFMVGLVGGSKLTVFLVCCSKFMVVLACGSKLGVLADGSELPFVSGGLGGMAAPLRRLMDLTPAARTPEKTSGVVLFFMAARFCKAPLCLLSRLPWNDKGGGEGGARARGEDNGVGEGLDPILGFGGSLCPSALHIVIVLLSHIFRSVASSSMLLWAGRFCTSPLPDTGYGGECLSPRTTSPTSMSVFWSKGELCLPCMIPLGDVGDAIHGLLSLDMSLTRPVMDGRGVASACEVCPEVAVRDDRVFLRWYGSWSVMLTSSSSLLKMTCVCG